MNNAKLSNTLIYKTTKLDKDESEKSVDTKLYKSMIGSLFYLTVSRPDIIYIFCLYARFQVNPKKIHLTAIKRIIHFMKGTLTFDLWYSRMGS